MGARQSNLSTTSSPNIQPTNAPSRRSNGASGSRGSSHNTNSHGNPNANLYNQVDNEDTDLNGGISHIINPVQFIHFPLNNELKCPLCSKTVLPDDAECHFVMCITKPRISYNEDTLTEYKGECVICLEDLDQGNIIARLPCLCIYHKKCIDSWFEINRSCPEHPSD